MIRKTISKAQPSIRIRAVDPWNPQHGEEPGYLDLSPSEQSEISRVAEIISFETKGSQIIAQGHAANHLFVLAEGVAEAEHILNSGERQVVAFYWPGDVFGLTEAGLYVNSVMALTPCRVYRLPIRKLETFLVENPKIQHRFFIKAVHDIRSTQRQLIAMGSFDVTQRLAMFLLDCSGHAHYFDPSSQILVLPMSRYDIADYLGTSAESVTRAMAVLERNLFIRRISPRQIELKQKQLQLFTDDS